MNDVPGDDRRELLRADLSWDERRRVLRVRHGIQVGSLCGGTRGRVAHRAAAHGLGRDKKPDGGGDAVGGAAVAECVAGQAPAADDAPGGVVSRWDRRGARVPLCTLLKGNPAIEIKFEASSDYLTIIKLH